MFGRKQDGGLAFSDSPLEKTPPGGTANAVATVGSGVGKAVPTMMHRTNPLLFCFFFAVVAAIVGVASIETGQGWTFGMAAFLGMSAFGFLTLWVMQESPKSNSTFIRFLEKVRLYLADDGQDKDTP